MPIRETTYEEVALEDPGGAWEFVCWHLRAKPAMTVEHSDTITALARLLMIQLGIGDYKVSVNLARLRIASGNYFVPDICVIPHSSVLRQRLERAGRLE